MRIVIPGGTGLLGRLLSRALRDGGHEVVVLSRSGGPGAVVWDGRTLGPWADHVDGAGAVVNLAGRTVDCRYTAGHLREMMDSRVESTLAIGLAIARAPQPPPVWLQMSTATIYAHRRDAPNDEPSGRIGGDEPDVPAAWRWSIDIARAWERAQEEAATPRTRKVAMRTAMVMSSAPGGVYAVLRRLARAGLGGPIASGGQYVSWIHEHDFVRAVTFLLERSDLAGPVNLAAPEPLPQGEFMAILRESVGIPMGLPMPAWLAELGAFLLRTETELVLKSRRVVPGRLLDAGFAFRFPRWREAAGELASRARRARPAPAGEVRAG